MSIGLMGGLPSMGGAAVVGGASPLGWASMGLNAIGGLGSMFGRSKMESSSATSTAANTSVFGDIGFGDSGINKPWIDLENPIHAGVLLFAVGMAVFIYKKVK